MKRPPLSFLPSFHSQVQTVANRNDGYFSVPWKTDGDVNFFTVPCLAYSLYSDSEFSADQRRCEGKVERKRGFKASNEPGGPDQLPAVFPTTLSCPTPPPHLTYTILIIGRIPTFLSFSIIFMSEILAGQLPTPKQSIEGRCKAGAKAVLLHS